jgi:transposase
MNYAFFVGIDISKLWFDAALLAVSKPRTTEHQRFDNTDKGFKTFVKWLGEHQAGDVSGVFVCLEHTGVYGVPLCEFLGKHALAYTLVPGAEIKQSAGIVRSKSDQVDARRIALYAYKNREFLRLHTLPTEVIRTLKALLALRQRLLKSKHGLVVAQKELTVFECDAIVQPITQHSKKAIEVLQEQIKAVDQALQNAVQSHTELKNTYDLLLSVPGIGIQNALYLIVVTQNFVAFDCPRKFANYAGVAPHVQSSGSSQKSRAKVSCFANKMVKTLMTSAVVCSLKTCAEYQTYYQKQLQRGKNPNSVKNALRNKIIHRVFAVMERQTPYVDTHSYAA